MLKRSFSKEKYVFCEDNDVAHVLTQDITKRNKNAVLFMLNNKWLKKIFLKNKTYLFFLSNHNDENIQSLSSFFSIWKSAEFEKVKSNVTLIVRVQDEWRKLEVENLIQNAPFKVAYTFFNDAELIASEIVKKFPPIDTLHVNTKSAEVNDSYETLIIGFDATGNAILRKVIENTQFVGTQFKATVLENNANSNQNSFDEHYPEIKNHYSVHFMDYKLESNQFSEWIKLHASKLKQIFISTGNDEENIEIALMLNALLQNYKIQHLAIVAVVRSKNSSETQWSSMYATGSDETIFTESNVLKLDYLHQAKAIHKFYNQLKPFAQRTTWEQLSNIKKESNIAAAESLYAKLKLIGKTVEEIKQMSEIEFQLYLQENPNRLLHLAIAEHLRWNATYFVHGWKTWHLQEIQKGASHQDEAQKRHACLVDWNTLKNVEKQFDIPFQIYDYNNIMIMKKLITSNVLVL
jgi:hypothetical protein